VQIKRDVDLKKGIDIYRYTEKAAPEIRKICCNNKYVLLFVVSGELQCDIEGNLYSVNTGDVVVVNDKEQCKIVFEQDMIFEIMEIIFDPNYPVFYFHQIAEILTCFDNRPKGMKNKICLEEHQAKKFIGMLERIEYVSNNIPYGDVVQKLCYFLDVLVFISSIYINYTEIEYGIRANKIVEIIDYINNHLSEDLSLSALAKRFFVSKNNLSFSFKGFTGTSVHNYIVFKRIQHSQKLLRNNHTVTEACIMSGFNDYAHFIRAFKKHVGITPLKYAKTYKKVEEKHITSESCDISIAESDKLPDLIVADIQWTPEEPAEGDSVLFYATIKNIGNMPTPPGVVIGVGFLVRHKSDHNDFTVTWNDNYNLPLLPGNSLTLSACGGNYGSDKWIAAPGDYIVTAYVNDINRIKESNRDNNMFSKDITVK